MLAMNINITAMIPARLGSTRLKMKNLALLNGKPLIYYAIKAAQDSNVFDRVVLNSDSEIFKKIAERYGAEFYHRPEDLGGSSIKSDMVVADFIRKNPCDVVVWVNPIAPLLTGKDVKSIVDTFLDKKYDTLFTVKCEQVHCNYKGHPLNYSQDEIFEQTQDLEPVQPFVYSIMMWRTEPFLKRMEDKGNAFFTGKVGYYEVDKLTCIIVKDKNDLLMAEMLMAADESQEAYQVNYDEIVGEDDSNG
jgi:CMP-N-acetylneuraminic acid synthetase